MRARQALTSSVDVIVPALMRAEASESVGAASESAATGDGVDDAVEPLVCADTAPAPRVAAAAAPTIVAVNARLERCVIGGNDTVAADISDVRFMTTMSHCAGP